MKKLFFLFLLLPFLGFCLDKLDEKYLVVFGDSQAPLKVTQYFSMSCPHCLSLFKKDFKAIKEQYINKNHVIWIFHPVPLDSLTIQAMDCLSHLTSRQKQIFLEVLLDTLEIEDDPNIALFLMQEAMKKFDKPIPDLDEKSYITKTGAFLDAFDFIKQEDSLQAVPAVEIGENLYRKEIPTQEFIEKQLRIRNFP